MGDFSGKQRNTPIPSRSPLLQQPQLLLAAPFRNSFPATPCSSWCSSKKAGCHLPEVPPATACPEPAPPPTLEWVSLAAKGRPWHFTKGPASLPIPSPITTPALEEDQLGEVRAGGGVDWGRRS